MSAGPTHASCTFCRIVCRELESCTVLEDETSLAFLDRRPLFHGHCLLVPRAHYETLLDLPPELVGPLFANARLIAQALEHGLGAEGSFVALNNRISQSVPHLHVHVVPRRRKDGLRGFFWPRTKYGSDEQMRQVGETLRSTIATLRSPS
ncbi:MAG: HIT family protein [Myxococcota bacterium]